MLFPVNTIWEEKQKNRTMNFSKYRGKFYTMNKFPVKIMSNGVEGLFLKKRKKKNKIGENVGICLNKKINLH